MKTYTKKQLVEMLELPSYDIQNLNDTFQATDQQIQSFKEELMEANMMILEEYSPESQRLYDFIYHKK